MVRRALGIVQHQELGRRPTPTCRSGQGGTPDPGGCGRSGNKADLSHRSSPRQEGLTRRADQDCRRPARPPHLGSRGRRRDGRGGCRAAGYPPAADRAAEPDAQQDRYRDAACPAAWRLAVAGGTDAGADQRPCVAQHLRRSYAVLLPRLERCARRAIRRFSDYRRPGRASAVRGGELLAGAARDLRLDPDPCASLAQHLLGGTGGAPSFSRGRETCAGAQGIRRVPPSQPCPGLALSAGLFGRFLDPRVALVGSAAGIAAGRSRAAIAGRQRGDRALLGA